DLVEVVFARDLAHDPRDARVAEDAVALRGPHVGDLCEVLLVDSTARRKTIEAAREEYVTVRRELDREPVDGPDRDEPALGDRDAGAAGPLHHLVLVLEDVR